jgi:hypothetical protein
MSLYIGLNKSKYYTDKWYGVEWDVTMATPDMARIGNMILHRQQPITSRMRRCLLLDNGNVNYYLDPLNSLMKGDGSAADLTGADGQLMVEIPLHYFREESVNNKLRWMFSEYPLPGFTLVPKHYVSALKATLQRSNSKLSSVINLTADFRGGNNNAAWDAEGRTLIGKAATVFSRTQGRTYAANRGAGWVMAIPTTYNAFRRLCYAEFATRNIQLAFNANLTADGFHQGGLGAGVTTANGTEWGNYNGYYPILNVGVTTGLGNASGVIDVVVPNLGGAGISRTLQANSYRGIENPFGDIWEWLDGYNMWAQTVGEGDKFLLYARDATNGLADNTSVGYTLIGELPRTENYVRQMHPGHLFPKVVGGSGSGSTTFWCDYFYTNAATSFGWRAPFVGGIAYNGAYAGLVCVLSFHSASGTSANFGSRLCFLGA